MLSWISVSLARPTNKVTQCASPLAGCPTVTVSLRDWEEDAPDLEERAPERARSTLYAAGGRQGRQPYIPLRCVKQSSEAFEIISMVKGGFNPP